VKVFVTGATGVLGQAAIRALTAEGHKVTGLARNAERAALVEAAGADVSTAQLFDLDAMTRALDGYEVVCNLATNIPSGLAGLRRGAWKVSDRIRVEGSRIVVRAAEAACVRRVVQESVSLLYADGGDDVLTESSPLAVTRAVEPSAVAESNAAEFEGPSRVAVVLRLGLLVGDDAITRWRLSQARSGRAIGLGDPHGWAHVLHPDDAGTAIASALLAPAGTYNVGADPVRRDEMTKVFGEAVGREDPAFLSRLVVKLAGERLELMSRSQRVSSDLFHETTGWKPRYDSFNTSWLSGALAHLP
jgi:nucleoside-diphosphate-sugar epimerase